MVSITKQNWYWRLHGVFLQTMFTAGYNTEDTIAAIATTEGVSAIGIIRVSGKAAFSVCNRIFKGKRLDLQDSHTVHYGFIADKNEAIVDEVMVSIFKSPKSFTTEDSVEISCHGSPFILEKVMQLLTDNGARVALPGEFTMRAFMHGRIDLAQAEAVGDLIAAENHAQHNIALKQIRGGLSDDIGKLRQQLLDFASLIELELDFGEEDVEFADRSDLVKLIQKINNHIQPIIDSFRFGNAIRNGIPVAIVGRPNAGKSSLLNRLLNDDRAIVSSIAGTTRDTIEEQFVIGGVTFRLIDTAGIRATTDEIEAIGVRKTYEKIEKADILVYLFDVNTLSVAEAMTDVLPMLRPHQKLVLCANKCDLKIHQLDEDDSAYIKEKLGDRPYTLLSVSAITGEHLDALKDIFTGDIRQTLEKGNTILTNIRHYTALKDASDALEKVLEGIDSKLTSDLLALEIKRALNALGEISGQITSQEILQNIFGKFCIGK